MYASLLHTAKEHVTRISLPPCVLQYSVLPHFILSCQYITVRFL